jgi:hypothetical protein
MAAGFVLGKGFTLRWVNRDAPIGIFRWWSGKVIGKSGYRAELRAHRCEKCRLILASY